MKRLLFFFGMFCFITNNFCQDINKEIKQLLSANPNQICLDQISKTLNITFNFGNYGNVAIDSIFAKFCINNPKLEEIKDGVQISGLSSYQNSPGKIRLTKQNNTVGFAVGIELAQDFKLGDLTPTFAPIDNLVKFSHVTLTISNITDPKPIFGKEPLIVGLNIAGKANFQGFIKDFTDPLALNNIDFFVKAPKDFKTFKDIKFGLNPNISQQGICIGKALAPLINELNFSFAKDFLNKLDTTCFGTETIMGITIDSQENTIFYISGKIINYDLGMLKVKKAKDGKITYTFGYKMFGSFNLSSIDTLLNPLDSIMKISGPSFIYTNADKDTVFDYNTESNTFDSALPTTLNVTQGFSLYGRVDMQGSIKEITEPLALSRTRVLLTLPKNAKKLKDLRINILPNPGQKICPFKALHTVITKTGINLDLEPDLIETLNEVCFGTDVGLIVDDDLTFTFFAQGIADKIGGDVIVEYRMPDTKSVDKSQGLSIGYKPSGEFKFSKINSNLGFIDSLITKISDVTIAISTANKLSVFDVKNRAIDRKLQGSTNDLVKGITISANAQVGTILGDALKIAAAQTVQLKILIPSSAKKLSDIKIGIETARGAQEQKICLSNIFGSLLSGSFSSIANTCITGKHIELMPNIENKSLKIQYDGTLTLFDKKDVDAKLLIDVKGTSPTAVLLAEVKGDLGLSSIASEFKPFEIFNLNNPKIVIANNDSDLNLLGTGSTKKGFTILSAINWGQSISKLMDSIGLASGLTTQINVPLNPSNLSGFSFTIDKNIDKEISKSIKFKKVHLEFKGSTTPTFGLAVNTLFDMPGSKNHNAKGEPGMDIMLAGNANAIGTVELEVDLKNRENLPLIDAPFGLPIKLTNPWVKVGFTAGVLSGVAVAGKLELGKSKVELTGELNLTDPNKSGLIGKDFSIDLADLFLFYKNFVPQLKDLQLPNILTMKIAQISINPTTSDLTIHAQTIPVGIKLLGKVDIPEIKTNGTININIDPKSLVLSGNANLTPINLGGIIKIVAANDSSKGPSLGLQLDIKEQKMWIDGYINLAGILESKTKIDFNKTGFLFDTTSLFAGMGSKVHAEVPLPKFENSNIEYTITDENLINFIQKDLISTVDNVNKQATNLKNDAQKTIEGLKNQCGNIVGISDICKGSLDATNETLKLLDIIFQTLTKKTAEITTKIVSKTTDFLKINNISASGNLSALTQGGKAITVKIDFNLFNKNYVKSLSIPIPKEAADLAGNLTKEIYALIQPILSPILDEIKVLVSKIKSFIEGTIHLIGTTVEVAKSAGVLIYQAGKMVLTLSPESAKEFVKAINTFGNDIQNFGKEIGGGIARIAQQTASSIKNIATSVGNAVEETWHNILRGGSLEYNYSILNNWKNPVNISVLGFAGDLKTTVCQVFANVPSGSTVNWKSKECMPNGIYWTDKNNNSNKVYFSNNGMRFDWNWQIASNGKITIPENWGPKCIKHEEKL